jgi:predicted esterase
MYEPLVNAHSEPEFHDLREHIMDLFGEGLNAQAVEAARRAWVRYPARGEIPFWIACGLSLLGRHGQALMVLEQAVGQGLWWDSEWLEHDDDLAPLRSRPEFAGIVGRSSRLREIYLSSYTPRTIVWTPDPHAMEALPAVVALHGWGGRAEDFVESWRPLLASGWTVVAPESSQVLSPEFFVWTDRATAGLDLAAAYRQVCSEYLIDEQQLIAAGFSQGGGVAVSSALGGQPFPATRFMVFGTGISDVDPVALQSLDHAANRQVRGWMAIGQDDPALADAIGLRDELDGHGIDCRLEIMAHAGHTIPADSAGLMRQGVDFLFGP